MAHIQLELQALKDDLAVLRLDQQQHAEKTKQSLESYRARKQPRKDGKFAPQEPAQSTLDGGLVESPTHADIENMARSTGLIR